MLGLWWTGVGRSTGSLEAGERERGRSRAAEHVNSQLGDPETNTDKAAAGWIGQRLEPVGLVCFPPEGGIGFATAVGSDGGALVNTRFAKYVFFGSKGPGVLEKLKRGDVGGVGNSKPFAVPLSTLRVEPARTSVATLQELRSIGAAVSCWRCDTQTGWRRK